MQETNVISITSGEREVIQRLPLARIQADPRLQMREALNQDAIADLVERLADGATLPPITVFRDGMTYWLADGFHRYGAYQRAKCEIAPCQVIDGPFADALRHAISANHNHGVRRTLGDCQRAYRTAVDHNLIDPGDTGAVQALLKCTARWARDLTKPARDQIAAERAAQREREHQAKAAEEAARQAKAEEWKQRAEAGESLREIARDEGTNHRNIARTIEGGTKTEKRKSSFSPNLSHPPSTPTPPDTPPTPEDTEAASIERAEFERWMAERWDRLHVDNAHMKWFAQHCESGNKQRNDLLEAHAYLIGHLKAAANHIEALNSLAAIYGTSACPIPTRDMVQPALDAIVAFYAEDPS